MAPEEYVTTQKGHTPHLITIMTWVRVRQRVPTCVACASAPAEVSEAPCAVSDIPPLSPSLLFEIRARCWHFSFTTCICVP